MNPDLQKSLRKHIEFFLENNPGSSIKDTKQWLRKGVHAQTILTLKKQAFNNFVKRNIKKFDTYSQCTEHAGGCGRPKIKDALEKKAEELGEKIKGASTRKISRKVGVSH